MPHRPGDTETAELRVGDGQLLEVKMNRWSKPRGSPFLRYPFG